MSTYPISCNLAVGSEFCQFGKKEVEYMLDYLQSGSNVADNPHYVDYKENCEYFRFSDVSMFKGMTDSQVTFCGD